MPTDQETLEIAYYIRDLVNASAETRELTNFFYDMLHTEKAVTMRELGDGFKLINVRDADGNIVDREKVLFTEQDYQRRSGIIEGLGWLEDEVNFRIKQANDEDKRKAEEKEKKE
jgi:hypothetical protein